MERREKTIQALWTLCYGCEQESLRLNYAGSIKSFIWVRGFVVLGRNIPVALYELKNWVGLSLTEGV